MKPYMKPVNAILIYISAERVIHIDTTLIHCPLHAILRLTADAVCGRPKKTIDGAFHYEIHNGWRLVNAIKSAYKCSILYRIICN